MIEVVVERARAVEWERAIVGRVGDAVAVVGVGGGFETEPDLSRAEIVISGWHDEGYARFAEILGKMAGLRWIHSVTAGLDGFATPSLAQRDLIVTSSGEAYAQAIAEHALGSMIALARGFPQMVRSQLEQRWEWDRAELEERGLGRLLSGKTVGIVGFGRVGRRVAVTCRGLGMDVWGLRRTPGEAGDEPLARLLGPSQLGELLRGSDFVVLSASLNRTTTAMIGAAELAAMKRSAVLVNVGRGDLIDQRALVEALRTGEIAGAALDVTTPEPLPPGDELWGLDNVLITPHVAGESAESDERVVEIFLDNLEVYLTGDPDQMPDQVDLAAHL